MTVHHATEHATLHHGDCIDIMRTLPAESVDAVVTDPPYGLEFMRRDWDSFKPASSKLRTRVDGRTNPAEGKSTVTTPESYVAGAPFQVWCQRWATECLRVLKPGGHMLAFGGARTWHRLTCAIEDAGFEIRDSIAWLYGSGFPKSHNLTGDHTGWGTALKPGYEPVCVARKPLAGTVATNVLTHGTGALNIDACRIAGVKGVPASPRKSANGGDAGGVYGRYEPLPTDTAGWDPNAGRWPANVVLDDDTAAELDAQSGVLSSGSMRAGTERQARPGGQIYGADRRNFSAADTYGDTGGASRFFYVAKAGGDERPRVNGVAHPTVKPLALMRWLCRLVTPSGGTVLEPFAGSGTTVEAALTEGFNCIAIEREADYLPLIVSRLTKPIQTGFTFEDAS